MSQDENNAVPASKAPSHAVYTVRDRKDAKGIFTRVGAAWPHKDGQGFNIQIDAVPLDGKLSLRVISEVKA